MDQKSYYLLVFNEIKRILKPDGRLGILKCNKNDLSLCPPLHMLISAMERETLISGYGFVKAGMADLGFNHMITFIHLLDIREYHSLMKIGNLGNVPADWIVTIREGSRLQTPLPGYEDAFLTAIFH